MDEGEQARECFEFPPHLAAGSWLKAFCAV